MFLHFQLLNAVLIAPPPSWFRFLVIIDLEVVGQLESSLLTRNKATHLMKTKEYMDPPIAGKAETTNEPPIDAKGLGDVHVSDGAIEGLENGSTDATPIVLQVRTHTCPPS